MSYNLGFISDEDIYQHVKATVEQYGRHLDLVKFNSNIIDPIKLTFDAKIYGQTIKEAIKSECIRQIDKSNNNKIGYFHQNLFKYACNGWQVPANGTKGGFDVINEDRHIFAEIKNKHNTMNRASASDTYIKMQDKLLMDDKAVCMLVEVISRHSQNDKWETSINKIGNPLKVSHERIRRVSMDKFYDIVFEDKNAFMKLCKALPVILDDVMTKEKNIGLDITVYKELRQKSKDLLRSLYILAFQEYDGFDEF